MRDTSERPFRRHHRLTNIHRIIARWLGRRGRGARSSLRVPAFDTTGWHERQRSETNVVWTNDERDSLSVNRSTSRPPWPLSDQDSWRSFCRELAEDRGSAIVSGDSFEEGPAPLFQFIYEREDGNGYLYGGQLFVPRPAGMWVIGGSAREHGTTGVREALVTAHLAGEGRLEIDRFETPDAIGAGGKVRNWFRDPYDLEYRGRVLRNMADDEEYDALVPHHPLSRLRRTLSTVRRTLRFEE